MAYNNIENNIVDTIQYMVDNAVAAASYDKTIQCTILSCEDESIGKYKVQYQDAIFYAYAGSADTTYSSGSNIYVLVPGNDSSREKTILGEVNKMGEGYMSIVDNNILFFPLGGNVVDISDGVDINQFRLWSYQSTEPTKEIPFVDSQEASSEDYIRIDNTNLKHNLAQVGYIKLGAKFTTNIPLEQQEDSGSYGIIFTLEFKTNSGIEDETVERTYTIDINDIINNPYGLDDFEWTMNFPVDGKNFLAVKKIEIYCRDFPIQKEHSLDPEVAALEYDIEIKDFIINAIDKIDESKLNGPWVTIVCPEGNSFDNNSLVETKRIKVNTYKGAQQINAESKKLQYFWFVEDARVDPDCEIIVGNNDPDITNPEEQVGKSYFDAFYCKYGGHGWKCLNSFHMIEEEEDTGTYDEHGRKIYTKKYIKEWEPGSFDFIIRKSKLVAKETKYKSAVLYNEYLMTDVKTFINYSAQYDINITTDTEETTFYFDTGEPILTCNVLYLGPDSGQLENYSYIWNKTNNLGKITYLKGATESSYQIFIRDIYNFATYTCFVFNNGIPIGQAAITITNSLESGGQYSLIITNGTQVYKYNEFGLAPNEGSTDDPIVIHPLGYILYDMLGKEVRHDIIADSGKEWLIPAENSMLEFDLSGIDSNKYYNADGTDYDEEKGGQKWYKFDIVEKGKGTDEALPYQIKDRYDYKYINNTVRLKIKYQGTYFIAETNFVFTKEGEPGTNGSEYYCRIIPNFIDGTQTNDPLVIIDEDFPYGEDKNLKFCLGGKRYDSQNLPLDNFLKVELWRNGKLIIDDKENHSSGISTEGVNYTINWTFLSNQYKKDEIYDFSYLKWKTIESVGEEPNRWRIYEAKYYKTNSQRGGQTTNFYLGKDWENNDFKNLAPYFDFDNNGVNGKVYHNAPALIAKCTINYNGMYYYAIYPIIWAKITGDLVDSEEGQFNFNIENGFSSVIYAADGRRPQYHDEPFEVKIYKNRENITENYNYQWLGYGGLYGKENEESENKQWIIDENYFKEIDYNIKGYYFGRKFYRDEEHKQEIIGRIDETYVDIITNIIYIWDSNEETFIEASHSRNDLSKYFKPLDEYDGHCVNTIIECLIKNNENYVLGTIQIPIHMMLNKYGHAALNEWDGNSISIDKDGNGVILAPQVGAGQKEKDNSFTGVLMRKSKRSKS